MAHAQTHTIISLARGIEFCLQAYALPTCLAAAHGSLSMVYNSRRFLGVIRGKTAWCQQCRLLALLSQALGCPCWLHVPLNSPGLLRAMPSNLALLNSPALLSNLALLSDAALLRASLTSPCLLRAVLKGPGLFGSPCMQKGILNVPCSLRSQSSLQANDVLMALLYSHGMLKSFGLLSNTALLEIRLTRSCLLRQMLKRPALLTQLGTDLGIAAAWGEVLTSELPLDMRCSTSVGTGTKAGNSHMRALISVSHPGVPNIG